MAPIRIATDCSGMEAPLQALRNLKEVEYRHVMSCDILPAARATIEKNFPDGKMYEDCTKRKHSLAPDCDLYVAGFPCQPFSIAGLKQGFEDDKMRGTIFFHCRDFIKAKQPKVFILENVKGLMQKSMADYLHAILQALKRLGKYNVYYSLMDTKQHGLPQSRPRFYIVGIRKDVDRGTFEFPKPIKMPSIEALLEPKSKRDDLDALPRATSTTAVRNVKNLEQKYGDDIYKVPFIADIDSSVRRSQAMRGCSPCITRSRASGHWVTTRGRRLTNEEMMRLQGMNPTEFHVAVKEKQLGQQIGNSMSLNVLERLFARLLPAAGLSGKIQDRWANGKAVEVLKATRGKTFKSVLEVPPPSAGRKRKQEASSAASKRTRC